MSTTGTYSKQTTWNETALVQINGGTLASGGSTLLPGTSVSFSHINDKVLTNVQDKENTLKAQIAALGSNPTTQDLLVLQQKMQEWSMLVDLQGTLAKTVAEQMKGVVQKSG